MAKVDDAPEMGAKSLEEVLNSPGNISTKFGLMAGLVNQGTVSDKDIVDAVLNLVFCQPPYMVGAQFDLEKNFIVEEADSVKEMMKLTESCSTKLQAEILSVFTAMVRKSKRNCQACTDISLIEYILERIDGAMDVVADLLIDLLSVLASYSITVKELKLIFNNLKARGGKWPMHATKLLQVLRHMPQRHGPDEFFSFPGKRGSAIALPPIARWPYQSGWTFSTWLRLDPVSGNAIEREKPYLYTFKTAKGIGYSAHFLGNALVITVMKIKGKGFQHCVKFDFLPRKWYMVSIVHVYNRWSKSELRCYVDGVMVSQTEMSWLVSSNDPFDKCTIGSSVDNDTESMFCGQMSSVYLFSEALTQTQLQAMYTLGPGYKSQFRFDNESHALISDIHQRVLYDSRLTQAIVFMYNPIACDSQLCLESSPKGNPSYFVHSPHALMLQDVKAVISHSIHSTLHSLGGIQVLFPLFGQIDCQQSDSDDEQKVDYSICATLMGLLCDLLESSTTIQQQFLQNKGFLVISHLLEKSSQGHITLAVLESFLKLTKYLVTLPSGTQLLKHLFDHILFNPALWIYTPVEVQRKLYSYLATEFINDAQIYNKIRRVSAVLQAMHSLKYYYWVQNPKDRSGITPKGNEGPRPNCEEVRELRAYMLQYIKHLILKGHGIHDDELQSVLNYLTTIHEDDNLLDVLEFTQTLMAQHPASMVPAFDRKHGVRAVYKLLASANEKIRISALKLLGYFLMRSTHKRKQDSMAPHNLFSLLGERLMLNAVQLTMATYNVLFEVLTERMANKVVAGNHSEPDSSHKLENPMILKVIASLIRQSRQTPHVMDVKRVFLSDLTIMCNNNRENRRTVLQMSVWQDWLFGMAYIYPKTPEEQRITDSVMSLFKMLLHHAVKYEYGGWRVWIDTLAILHSKVSYEDFKIHMAQMYRQYEQQRVDDIADPDIRREFPVSTISGVGADPPRRKRKSSVEIREVTEEAADQVTDRAGMERTEGEGSDYSSKTDENPSEPKSMDSAERSDTESAESEKVESEQKTEELKTDKAEPELTPTGENDATESEEAEKSTDSKDETDDHDVTSHDVRVVVNDVVNGAVDKAEGTERAESDVKSEPRSTTNSPTSEEPPSTIGSEQTTSVSVTEQSNVNVITEPSIPRSDTEPELRHPDVHPNVDVRNVRAYSDVRSDMRRTQSMHVNSGRPGNLPRQASLHRQGSGRHIFSPGPRAPPFRIPEFKWSYLHQKLLSELLFSIETDVQVWKTHTTKTVIDFVNTAENHVFVVNVIHMISQLSDNLVTACGGLLPLLAAATSPNCELDMLEPSQGLSIEQAVSFLQRVMNLTDVLVFASSTNFGELEQEKNMSSGGILRQCLRLVSTCAVRNCLECRHRQSLSRSTQATPLHQSHSGLGGQTTPQRRSSDVIQALVSARRGDGKLPVPDVGGQSPVKDLEKLLQDMDVNRLRAVVYRDVEETKQAQFLALAIVYFVSVLMVSKYRDILEPPSPAETPAGTPARHTITTPLNADTAEHDASEEVDNEEEEEEEPQAEPETVLNSSGDDLEPSPTHVQVAVDIHHGDHAKQVGDGDNQSQHTATSNQELDDEGGAKDHSSNEGVAEDDVTDEGVAKDDVTDEGVAKDDVTEEGVAKDDGTEESVAKDDVTEEGVAKDDVTEGVPKDDVTEEGVATEKSEEGGAGDATDGAAKEDGTDIPEVGVATDTQDAEAGTNDDHVTVEGVTTEETGDEEKSDTAEVSAEDVKVEVSEDAEPVKESESDAKSDTKSETKSETDSVQKEQAKPIVNGEHDPDKSSSATGGSQSETSSQKTEDGQYQEQHQHQDQGQHRIAAISLSDDQHNRPASLDLTARIPSPLSNLPVAPSTGSLTDRLERALGSSSPLLREIFVDFAPFLSKTLLGSHGQELLIGGLVTLKQSSSVVELVMLLCSQEWQNSLQKHAGLAFIELVNEGRLLAHATRDHIVRVANEAEFILNRMRADDVQKHAEFETCCAQTMCDRRDEEKLCDHLITSARQRDHVIASKIREKIVNIMTNKHGAWGSPTRKARDFWKLDTWEDDSRRRRRLVKNPVGSTHPEATLKAALEHGATEDAISQAREAFHAHLARLQGGQQLQGGQEPPEEELAMNENELDAEFAGPVALSTPCKLLAPGVVVDGTMSVTKSEMYFEMDEDSVENKKIDAKVMTYVEHLHGKWHFSEIRAIFARKYLLQNTAIEIFMANRSAVMFSFPDNATVKKVINVLPRVGVGVKYGLPQARRTSMASAKQLFKQSNMMQKWQRREISNFDYLMYLNTVAGRSYNDLNQYPVFPWVLVNYESNELDLTLPSNYRDLSKPVGALNPTRRAFFEERYSTWEHDQIPPFHYGTHYSTAAFTLNWLIRVEPFTTFFLALQGGKFDHANRTFHSLSQSWKNSQRDTSDVKELIPEFYFLPEMFMNDNAFNLGTQEDGVTVHDVMLPPWANTAEEFVRMNRMALESEFVSCQLHQWIDLIFGYKQKGPEAVRATNVFYYLTYEGSVNLENMNDPVMKEAIQNQIRSFGQTPSQLMTEPHPPRSSAMHMTPMMFSQQPDDVCMIMKFLSNSPVTFLAANTHPTVPQPAVTAITCNHNFSVNRWNPQASLYNPNPGYAGAQTDRADGTAQLPISMDQVLVMGTNLQKRNLGDNFDQRLSVTQSHFLTTSDNRIIMAAGFWDKSFRVFTTESAKILQVVYGHFDIVTCIARSECNIAQDCYVVTGSKDCTVMVWLWSSKHSSIIGENGLENPTPKVALTGHLQEVTCVAVSAELGLVFSGSKEGPCLVHTTQGDLLRSLDAPESYRTPNLVAFAREGYIIASYDWGNMATFTVNGKQLRHVKHNDRIQAITLSRDGQYMIMGGDNGVVEVWRTHDLSLLYTYPPCDSSVRSLALSHCQRYLMAGLATGCIIVFNIDFNKWHHEFQDKY